MVNIYEANQKIPAVILGMNLILLVVTLFFNNLFISLTTIFLNIIFCGTFVVIKKYGFYFELIINSKHLKVSKVMESLDKTLKKY